MFFVRAVGVKVRVRGTERIPPGVCLFVANHNQLCGRAGGGRRDPPEDCGAAETIAFKWPIVGQAFWSAHFFL